MTTTLEEGSAIAAGYLWSLRIEMDVDAFPAGVSLQGHVRRRVNDSVIMASLSTADGSIVRVDSRSIDIVLAGETTKSWGAGSVVLDLVRTDTDPDQYLGFTLTVPVVQTVTRNLA